MARSRTPSRCSKGGGDDDREAPTICGDC
jgi:hypothetical protein